MVEADFGLAEDNEIKQSLSDYVKRGETVRVVTLLRLRDSFEIFRSKLTKKLESASRKK